MPLTGHSVSRGDRRFGRSRTPPMRRWFSSFSACAEDRMAVYIHTPCGGCTKVISRMPPADVPVRVREPVVRIGAREPGVRQPVVQVPEGLPQVPASVPYAPLISLPLTSAQANAWRMFKGLRGEDPSWRLRPPIHHWNHWEKAARRCSSSRS